jgi:3-deoxy-manno-octulosonate cytidylyltransferase (CMP-KDO synthetase)
MSGVDRAVVATDDERILGHVQAIGGQQAAMMTSTAHRSGTDRCGEVLRRLNEQGEHYDVVVNIQGDEPFIQASQIRTVVSCFDDPTTQIATLVKPFVPADGCAALFNVNSPKVVVDNEMHALYFSRSVIPYLRGVPQEDWLSRHTFYKHIGLYAYRSDTLLEITRLPQSSLELAESLEQLRWLQNGYVIKVGVSDVETIGIETPDDLARAEEFLKQLKK